ncbi:MAG TPA: methyltransferase domain-containing protein [Vicinamibacterales bacterium]|nr:methyltransferase domain-containing protein [Vicinamibacterales bacterium]
MVSPDIQTIARQRWTVHYQITPMADWNAERYHAVSTPQQAWGRRIVDRLALQGFEHVLDIGCGTGRVTAEIAARVPAGRVVGIDRSAAMLETARPWLSERAAPVTLVRGDGAALPFQRAFDAVFSAATFHWVHDHGALFRSIIQALKPGGRLNAQCGGEGNLAVLKARADRLVQQPRFAPYFDDWVEPTYYADAASTERRLAAAGFVDINVWMEAAPTTFDGPDDFRQFIGNVCVREHVARLLREDREAFLRELTVAAVADTPPLTLDYWRLNIVAKRPA